METSRSLCLTALSMESEQSITLRPLGFGDLTRAKLGQCAHRDTDFRRNPRLCATGVFDVINDFVPIHSEFLSTSRNNTLRPVETQQCDHSEMSTLAERITSIRTGRGWRKSELQRRAGLKSASTITELENGTIIDSPQLPLIANALGVNVMWLQFWRGKKDVGGQQVGQAETASLGQIAIDIATIADTFSAKEQEEFLKYLMFMRDKNALTAKISAKINTRKPKSAGDSLDDHPDH